jgi:hypothetical protein
MWKPHLKADDVQNCKKSHQLGMVIDSTSFHSRGLTSTIEKQQALLRAANIQLRYCALLNEMCFG